MLQDIYGAKSGDQIQVGNLHEYLKDVYLEALVNNKWIMPIDQETVEIMRVTNVRITDIVTHLECGYDPDYGEIRVSIPYHINLHSLRCTLNKKMKGHKVKFEENLLIFTARPKNFSTKNLFDDFCEGDTRTVRGDHDTNLLSLRSHIYRAAKDHKVTVNCTIHNSSLIIRHKGQLVDKDSQAGLRQKLNQWLSEISYDKPMVIPDEYLTDFTVTDYRGVIHASKYNCKISKGTVTKLSVALNASRGSVRLWVHETLVSTFPRATVKRLTIKDKKLIDLLLMPYNLKFKDVK